MSVQRIDRDSVKQILDGYIKGGHYVFIKFYGADCPYCHNLAPLYKEMSDRYENAYFYAFNMEDGIGFEDKYNFQGVPSICFVKTMGRNTQDPLFLSEPDTPDAEPDGRWYHPQDEGKICWRLKGINKR